MNDKNNEFNNVKLSVKDRIKIFDNKETKTEDKKNIIKFDNEKIVDEVVGDKVVTLYWNTLLCVRKFNEYVFFIQKDITGMFITIDSKHFDEIKNYIRENNINVNIVE